MPGMGPVLPALLGWIGTVRMAWRWWAGLGIKDQPQFGKTGVWKEPPEEDSMDGANPAPSAGDFPGEWEQPHEQAENTDLPVTTN